MNRRSFFGVLAAAALGAMTRVYQPKLAAPDPWARAWVDRQIPPGGPVIDLDCLHGLLIDRQDLRAAMLRNGLPPEFARKRNLLLEHARNARLELEARENAVDLMADYRREQEARDRAGLSRPT